MKNNRNIKLNLRVILLSMGLIGLVYFFIIPKIVDWRENTLSGDDKKEKQARAIREYLQLFNEAARKNFAPDKALIHRSKQPLLIFKYKRDERIGVYKLNDADQNIFGQLILQKKNDAKLTSGVFYDGYLMDDFKISFCSSGDSIANNTMLASQGEILEKKDSSNYILFKTVSSGFFILNKNKADVGFAFDRCGGECTKISYRVAVISKKKSLYFIVYYQTKGKIIEQKEFYELLNLRTDKIELKNQESDSAL